MNEAKWPYTENETPQMRVFIRDAVIRANAPSASSAEAGAVFMVRILREKGLLNESK